MEIDIEYYDNIKVNEYCINIDAYHTDVMKIKLIRLVSRQDHIQKAQNAKYTHFVIKQTLGHVFFFWT